MPASDAGNAADREIVTTRVFNAPRELVFKAWTEPEHLRRWWGPKGFTSTFHEFDLRPGGVWRFVMHGPDGTDYKNESVFVEIVKPERIVFDHLSGPRFRGTATFEDLGGKTKITFRQLFESAAAYEKVKPVAVPGNEENFDKLAGHLATMGLNRNELTITRVFDAPRALVFKVWTDARHLAQWWGPKGFTNPRCETELRPGGAIRIDMQGPDGVTYPMTGVFHEIIEPERLFFTTCAHADENGNPRLEVLNTVSFAERNGKTVVTLRAVVVKSTPEVLAALEGMEEGWSQSLDRLAAHVTRERRGPV
ncbi:MAG TPA: SRPBCC domain-containing protein [Myxococcota bacterium]|nr:SRPBCC domain-containing protein [Myxococcota bacterium]